ncbi:ThuA domain-containing protein [Streptomyces sp. NPDC051940]|uniref:ThuA domain-containing protein n=1 Tax=Streptomyces sp. NPDC051940 TaxID=3155675 RepID=UPI003419D647
MTSGHRQALVVRGGADGDRSVRTTNLFMSFLRDNGFRILVEDSLEVYEDEDLLVRTDLIVQSWTRGDITARESAGLVAAVRAGTGFAGWHGGVVDAYREDLDYQMLTGGTFVMRRQGPGRHRVRLAEEHTDHPVIAGLGDFDVDTEPYWTLNDPLNDVLATVTFDADDTRQRSAAIPAVWARSWGKGRVFVSTVGSGPEDFRNPHVRALTERGLLWASR